MKTWSASRCRAWLADSTRTRPGPAGDRGRLASAAMALRRRRNSLAVDRPSAEAVPPLLALAPLAQFTAQQFQRLRVAAVFLSRPHHAQVRGEALQPGDVFRQRRGCGGVVPRLEETVDEVAALLGQLVGAAPARFLGLLVLQARLLLLRPALHRPQHRVAAARLGQQTQQRLGPLRHVRLVGLRPRRAEVGVAQQGRDAGEGPVVVGQAHRPQQQPPPPGCASTARRPPPPPARRTRRTLPSARRHTATRRGGRRERRRPRRRRAAVA